MPSSRRSTAAAPARRRAPCCPATTVCSSSGHIRAQNSPGRFLRPVPQLLQVPRRRPDEVADHQRRPQLTRPSALFPRTRTRGRWIDGAQPHRPAVLMRESCPVPLSRPACRPGPPRTRTGPSRTGRYRPMNTAADLAAIPARPATPATTSRPGVEMPTVPDPGHDRLLQRTTACPPARPSIAGQRRRWGLHFPAGQARHRGLADQPPRPLHQRRRGEPFVRTGPCRSPSAARRAPSAPSHRHSLFYRRSSSATRRIITCRSHCSPAQ